MNTVEEIDQNVQIIISAINQAIKQSASIIESLRNRATYQTTFFKCSGK